MSSPKGNIKVVLEGRGPLTLRDSNYITAGGEGSIYRANSTVVKLYSDPAKMVRDGMADKVKLLSKLSHPGIVAPQGLVQDEQGRSLGFYMPWVEGEPMSRVFVSDFRTRTSFGDKEALMLVDRMRETVQHTHGHSITMVDANELNWLVKYPDKAGPQPFVIDVDSWAVGNWPATVIMPSIRDWHAKAFNQFTDWFAWGIVTFQVFTGIHPYKGKLDGYKPGELEKRMRANASVFSSGVRLPHAVRDFSCIPGPLLDWYQATFQQGERIVPPSPFDTKKTAKAAQVLRKVVMATGSLLFEKLFRRAGDPVIRTWPSGAAWLASGELVDMTSGARIGKLTSSDAEVVKVGSGWLLADWVNASPAYHYVEGQTSTPLVMTMATQRFFRSGQRLFVVSDLELVELQLRTMGKPLLTLGQRWQVRPNATHWFDGVAVVDMLGATFMYLPLVDGGMVQVRAKELDGLQSITARAGNRFVVVMAVDRQGDYHKLEFTFDKTYGSYTLWQGRVDSPDLNVALLPNGVMATVLDDGELTIFVALNGNLKQVQDRGITTAMHLTTWDDKVIYIQDGNVWRVKVK